MLRMNHLRSVMSSTWLIAPPLMFGMAGMMEQSLRRRDVRHPPLAENRLVVRRRRKLPCPGRGRAHVGVHMDIEQERLVRLDGVLERALEVLRPGDRDAFDAG